jgi:hypothetical protein
VVAPGGRIRISGNAGGCRRGATVFVLARVLAGRSFAGLGAIAARVHAHGRFAASGHLRRNTKPGRYTLSARCGGASLGVTALIRVT